MLFLSVDSDKKITKYEENMSLMTCFKQTSGNNSKKKIKLSWKVSLKSVLRNIKLTHTQHN